MLTLWNINDDDDNVIVVVIPREPASLGCPVAERDTVPLARWVVCGSGDVGMPVVPTCGSWSSFGAWLSLSPCWAFTVIHLVLAVGCRSLSSLCAVIELLGRGRRFGRLGLFVVVWLV